MPEMASRYARTDSWTAASVTPDTRMMPARWRSRNHTTSQPIDDGAPLTVGLGINWYGFGGGGGVPDIR